jgi:plasmid stabilization system protein ParE
MLKVYLSEIAEKKLDLLLDYLETEWSEKSKSNFINRLKKAFKKIASHPKSCPESESYKNLYKCLVTKQTTLYYRILDYEIEVVTIKDNRQSPETIEKEIKHWRQQW